MLNNTFGSKLALTLIAGVVTATSIAGSPMPFAKSAVAFPFSFVKGHDDAKTTALDTAEAIARQGDYASVPREKAKNAWRALGYGTPSTVPSRRQLSAFGKKVGASRVLYGTVSWHTRSIWVNLGPKTISTATVSAYIFDVNTGKVTYSRKGVQGRSDEKENGLKVAGAILLTPLVTAVSGGPATPREQRAVQIALYRAYTPWLQRMGKG